MNEILVPIDKAGRVVLPKNVREHLGIDPGDMLNISIHGNEITIRAKKNTAGFVRRGRALVFSSGGDDLLDRATVEAVIASGRENDVAGKLSVR